MLTLSRRRLLAAATAARATLDASSAVYASWSVTVETPLYQAREHEGQTVFCCKRSNQIFASARAFVQHAQQLRRDDKDEQDLVFEDAARQTAKVDHAKPTGGRQNAAPQTQGAVCESVRSGSLELLLMTTPNGGEEVRLRTEAHELVGVTAIRQWIQRADLSDDKPARSLINLIKIYIPVQPRPGYTLEKAFTVIRRKATTTVAVHATTQPSCIPEVPNPAPYTIGNPEERDGLPHVTSVDHRASIPPPPAPYGREVTREIGFRLDECSMAGTAENPLVQTPSGQLTLVEFAALTNSKAYDAAPLVRSARKYLMMRWNEP